MPRKFAIQFAEHLQKQVWWDPQATYILGLSGGMDSMALTHLMQEQSARIILAHVNFNLRGADSMADEQFVKTQAETLNIPLEIHSVDTRAYANEQGVSIEMAAREIRYAWFEQLRETHQAKGILTAHHANDLAETVLLNMSRGMGIYGLDGISSGKQNLYRPLLFAGKDLIENYVQEEKIAYRVDASNADIQIPRNRIRHRILPDFIQINSKAIEHVGQSALRVQQMLSLYHEYVRVLKETFTISDHQLDLERLKLREDAAHLLFEFLREIGVNGEQAEAILQARSGSQFKTATHVLWINRGVLEVQKKEEYLDAEFMLVLDAPSCVRFQAHGRERQICIEAYAISSKEQLSADPLCIYVEQSVLQFPLSIRYWQKGDEFQPFGMKNTKKLSDFFVDEKYSPIQKQEQLLLCDAEDILWLVGKRVSEKLRVQQFNTPLYRILIE